MFTLTKRKFKLFLDGVYTFVVYNQRLTVGNCVFFSNKLQREYPEGVPQSVVLYMPAVTVIDLHGL